MGQKCVILTEPKTKVSLLPKQYCEQNPRLILNITYLQKLVTAPNTFLTCTDATAQHRSKHIYSGVHSLDPHLVF